MLLDSWVIPITETQKMNFLQAMPNSEGKAAVFQLRKEETVWISSS
jgi:hypothetical protein